MTAHRSLATLAGALLVLAVGAILRGSEPSASGVAGVPDDARPPSTAAPLGDLVAMDVLAARTVDRLLLFRTGNSTSSMTLGAEEVTALLTGGLPGLLPRGVTNIAVHLQGGGIVLRADVITGAWSGAHRLRPWLVVLPDTVSAQLDGTIVRVGRRLVFEATSARAQGVPLPEAVLDALVRELPTSFEASNGPVLRVSLPDGIADVRIVDDRFVLYAAEPNLERAVDDGADG